MTISKAKLYYLLLAVFLLQPIVQSAIGIFRYYDEILVFAFFLYYLLTKKIEKYDLILLANWLILILIGLLGNLASQAGQPPAAVIQDIISNSKLILFAISARRTVLSENQQEKLSDYLSNTVRFLFFVLFSSAMVSFFVDLGLTTKERYGIPSYRFLFNNAAILNTYYYYYMTIFSITLFTKGRLRKNSVLFLGMAVIPWVLTLRIRAFAFALLYVFLFFYIVFLRNNRKEYRFRWYNLLIIAVLLVLLTWDSIVKYFIANDRVSRYQLLRKSFVIAKDYFPIGSGFGTFGTQASKEYYCQLYYRYGLSRIYGLNPEHPAFVTDQYWFGILGQFGWLGMPIMAFMLFQIYKDVWKVSRKKKNMQLAALTLFYTSAFSSFTAGSFNHTSIIASVMLFYLFRDSSSTRRLLGG